MNLAKGVALQMNAQTCDVVAKILHTPLLVCYAAQSNECAKHINTFAVMCCNSMHKCCVECKEQEVQSIVTNQK